MEWQIKSSLVPHTLSELESILLENRHISDKELFLHPSHPQEIDITAVGIDPKQLKKALKRLKQAKTEEETIIVFGDYDADGVSATTIMWQTLYGLGFKAQPFIPHREKHGYGMSDRSLDDLLSGTKPSLVITVDTGIVAHDAVARLQEAEIDVIITDHHQPELVLPPALAVLHTDQLCGATVAWMVAREVQRAFGATLDRNWQLDLAGIATIADQVPLVGANRSFATHGLATLRETTRVGLVALFNQAGINPPDITEQTIGFGIAPRINAMGRLGHSLDALRLLCTNNQNRAVQLAAKLGSTNAERQDLTTQMFQHAVAQAKTWDDQSIIIVHSEEYHEGVIGLIAGRLVEQFSKPAIALSVGGGVAKASARSVKGVNIVELIRQVKDDLLEVGGHPMAAGFGVEAAKLDQVITRLRTLATEQISASLLKQSVLLDAELPAELISFDTIKLLDQFAPFGQFNEPPLFAIRDMEILEIITLGKDKRHLKLIVRKSDDVQPIEVLVWRNGHRASELRAGAKIDIAGVPEVNEWKGKKKIQIKAVDLLL